MARIKEMDSKITVVYSLATGNIKMVVGGIQSMDMYGENKADFNYGVLVVDRDDYVLNNYEKLAVTEGKLKLKDEHINVLQKYV